MMGEVLVEETYKHDVDETQLHNILYLVEKTV